MSDALRIGDCAAGSNAGVTRATPGDAQLQMRPVPVQLSREVRGNQFVGQTLPDLIGARYAAHFITRADRDAIDATASFLKQAQ